SSKHKPLNSAPNSKHATNNSLYVTLASRLCNNSVYAPCIPARLSPLSTFVLCTLSLCTSF
ncbi:MAG: hypothetical protein IJ920_10480, partial [Paludibacteraceae bacterium]|nr:hypothetical protein [Paludibacteraceae bacterium]